MVSFPHGAAGLQVHAAQQGVAAKAAVERHGRLLHAALLLLALGMVEKAELGALLRVNVAAADGNAADGGVMADNTAIHALERGRQEAATLVAGRRLAEASGPGRAGAP